MQNSKTNFSAGDVYASITLTGNSEYRQQKGGRRLYVEGRCKCGDIRGYALRFLINGNTKSCGCERYENMLKAVAIHRLSKHPLYSVYRDMVRRCCNSNTKSYHNYGGRGISVCKEWLDDVFSFRSWAILNGYEKGLQIDRIDNEGNYQPSNCRFVTREVNIRNTRRNVYVEAFGERKTLTDWADDIRCEVGVETLRSRYRRGNMSFEDAMQLKASANHKEIQRNSKSSRQITAWGETKSIIEWSEDERCKIGYSGLKIRLSKDWSIEKAISTPSFRKINK